MGMWFVPGGAWLRSSLEKLSERRTETPEMREKQECDWILQNLFRTRREWEAAECRFNETTVPELMDAAAYQVMAERAKYAYFMRRAKEKNLRF